jgi:hypothetical protein
MSSLYLEIEPLDRPPAGAGTFVVYWPDKEATSKLHNSHPDKRVVDSEAGDVLILLRQRYRMVGVQPFGDWRGPWFTSVRECLGA